MNPKTTAAVVVVLMLLAGIILGVAGDRAWLFAHDRLVPSPRIEQGFVNRLVAHLDREVHFTPQQREQVITILEAHHGRIDALWAGVRAQVRQQADQAQGEIEKVLTPDQRTKFEQVWTQMRQRHERGHFRH